MSGRLVVVRPEPGAARTVARGQAMGLAMARYPLFAVAPVAWDAPEPAQYDALLLTSANAVRHGGDMLGRLHALPVLAVGEATADAACSAGMTVVAVGDADAQALIDEAQRRGFRALFHPCGRDRRAIDAGAIRIDSVAVYAAVEAGDAAGLAQVLVPGDVLLVHSPRAGARLASLIAEESKQKFSLAAISPNALHAAGAGWVQAAAIAHPDDSALLALGARLCE